MSYTVYIDDSGSKNYPTPYSRLYVDNPPPYKGAVGFWRGNYFVMCGVRVEDENRESLNSQINSLKESCFGTHRVEIRSVWMRIPEKRSAYYLIPYGITNEQLNDFGERYHDLISSNHKSMSLFAVVFDKRFYGPLRASPEGNPLLKTAQVLFERIHSCCGANTSIVFDQMESSLSIKRGAHNKINGVYVTNEGMTNIYTKSYSNITKIEFKQSCSENFLQVADACAYNVYRQFIENGRFWDGSQKNPQGEAILPTYKYFNRIRCNFFAGGVLSRRVRGYGLVCIPDKAKKNWIIHKDCPA